ncbi:male sterility protein-domain-containing protein [Aspergillus welwitschiae]|uniref:Fatty acyl-CoA reductase n=1 Tax=Aspergillus welwitschiae TaxID=1341132 RepID=A0A3F3PXY0_9EURO|nr:male sterility protein-domain-containing protein [Aspergillus welwitschiae]RDH31622.1 male sterility protein-domain-containing protein [Aspergillus welwitschiae]
MPGPDLAPYQNEVKRIGYATSYERQTVLLTGSTGSLGGCILYKLAVQLPTRKIFVLIRGSSELAVKKWKKAMPDHTQAILNSNRIHYIVGDIRKSNFGIEDVMLNRLREEVTLVIHAAARIKLDASISEALENNCLPALELAAMVSRFRRLRLFIQISTAYVNSFLPDGYVGERLYPISDDDPEDELATIQATGHSPYTDRFSSSYTHAKHLMERLTFKRYPMLPVLFVRPTIFGPAVRHPYPLYGPEDSTPLTKFSTLYFSDQGGTQIWHAAEGYTSAAGTQGIVHIGSQLYVSHTFDEILAICRENAPEEIRHELPKIIFVQDRSIPQHILAELVKVGTRNWVFDCGRSYWLKQLGGPLSLAICQLDSERLASARTKEAYEKVLRRMGKL